ncbi:MAG: hypothetical protein LBC70_10735 [Chitinispirillales bacterium]|jgi:hypothetical protein|nr:hypothetical protein [Chitinispirillales bacterium]
MAIVRMTLEEAVNSITKEDRARAREAAKREPDLTDPDVAPEMTDEQFAKAFRPGRNFDSFEEGYVAMWRHFASVEECPVEREKIFAIIREFTERHPHLIGCEEVLEECLV